MCVHLAVFVNRLCNGDDMNFVKASLEGCASMSRCPKADALLAEIRIRLFRIVGRNQTRDIDQHRRWCRLTCERVDGHGRYVARNRGHPVN